MMTGRKKKAGLIIATLTAFLLFPVSTLAGRVLGKGAAGAAGATQTWAQEMMGIEAQRQRDDAAYQHERDQQKRHDREQQQNNTAIQQIESTHPDWRNLVRTKDYLDWMAAQPESVRSLANSNQAIDTMILIDLYKHDRGRKVKP